MRVCRRVLDDLITVTEGDVRDAMLRLAVEDRVVAEGAGALAAAALTMVPGRRKVAVVSGGNVDLEALLALRPREGLVPSPIVDAPRRAITEPLATVSLSSA